MFRRLKAGPSDFNPRTPRGGATASTSVAHLAMVFQSTHPTRGCDSDGYYLSGVSPISIHAPHEGVRQGGVKNFHRGCISIHAPHEGVRLRGKVRHGDNNKCQSTHPTRGCDHFLEYFVISFQFQSTHPTRGCDLIGSRSD